MVRVRGFLNLFLTLAPDLTLTLTVIEPQP